jgi:hypothetical protein
VEGALRDFPKFDPIIYTCGLKLIRHREGNDQNPHLLLGILPLHRTLVFQYLANRGPPKRALLHLDNQGPFILVLENQVCQTMPSFGLSL